MSKSFLKFVSGLLFAFMISTLPSQAHKVVISAYAEGNIIEGEIGFSGGDMAANIPVEILDDNDNVIGEVSTDAEGIFQFKPTRAVPLTFRANLGQGHVAIYRMEVDELPEGLDQALSADGPDTHTTTSPNAPAVAINDNVDSASLQVMIDLAVKKELEKFKPEIANAVRREVKPLRREIAAYKEKNDFQSILGGIGFIVGLFGVGFYFSARNERKKAQDLKGSSA